MKKRAFLKWAGGKYSLIDDIKANLPQKKTLVEPFVGAGSVFLNTNYDHYILSDLNSDLINLYKIIQKEPFSFIHESKKLFTSKFNDKDEYLRIRESFNSTSDQFLRSIYFLYLNRHCFNGLCRYNKKGVFNVPFGRYIKPYFPEKEILFFSEKAKKAEFFCQSYIDTFDLITKESVVYCDPPYAPLSSTSNFTSYVSNGFNLDDQAKLANLAEKSAKLTSILISNHDTPLTRRLYKGAKLNTIKVKRVIGQTKSSRKKVNELFALFD